MGQMSARCALHGVGQLRSFHLHSAMPNGPDVSGMSTARGRATKVLPLTLCNSEWARCQWDEHGEGEATKVLPLTNCNSEWAKCQRDAHGEGLLTGECSTYFL